MNQLSAENSAASARGSWKSRKKHTHESTCSRKCLLVIQAPPGLAPDIVYTCRLKKQHSDAALRWHPGQNSIIKLNWLKGMQWISQHSVRSALLSQIKARGQKRVNINLSGVGEKQKTHSGLDPMFYFLCMCVCMIFILVLYGITWFVSVRKQLVFRVCVPI